MAMTTRHRQTEDVDAALPGWQHELVQRIVYCRTPVTGITIQLMSSTHVLGSAKAAVDEACRSSKPYAGQHTSA
jgi:hypothetical protein